MTHICTAMTFWVFIKLPHFGWCKHALKLNIKKTLIFMDFKEYKTKIHKMFLATHLVCQIFTILHYFIMLCVTQGDKWVVAIYMDKPGEVFACWLLMIVLLMCFRHFYCQLSFPCSVSWHPVSISLPRGLHYKAILRQLKMK